MRMLLKQRQGGKRSDNYEDLMSISGKKAINNGMLRHND